MRKLIFTGLFLSFAIFSLAQTQKATNATTAKKKTTTKTTTKKVKGTWQKGGSINLTLSQGGSRNWAPGADRFNLAANAFVNLYANHTKGKCQLNTSLDANYGLVNTERWGTIKNDDKLEVLNKWSHEIGKPNKKGKNRYRLSLTNNFRSQFTDGYDYDNAEAPKRISSFLAPGILVVSPGIDYVEIKGLTVHVSPIAGRWILVPNRPYELASNYGVKSNMEVKNEFGTYLSIGYTGGLMKNVCLRSRLDMYSNYVDNTPGNVDFYLTNTLYCKINKYFGLVYSLDLQYDDNTKIFGYNKNATRTQLKSILGLGLSYKF